MPLFHPNARIVDARVVEELTTVLFSEDGRAQAYRVYKLNDVATGDNLTIAILRNRTQEMKVGDFVAVQVREWSEEDADLENKQRFAKDGLVGMVRVIENSYDRALLQQRQQGFDPGLT